MRNSLRRTASRLLPGAPPRTPRAGGTGAARLSERSRSSRRSCRAASAAAPAGPAPRRRAAAAGAAAAPAAPPVGVAAPAPRPTRWPAAARPDAEQISPTAAAFSSGRMKAGAGLPAPRTAYRGIRADRLGGAGVGHSEGGTANSCSARRCSRKRWSPPPSRHSGLERGSPTWAAPRPGARSCRGKSNCPAPRFPAEMGWLCHRFVGKLPDPERLGDCLEPGARDRATDANETKTTPSGNVELKRRAPRPRSRARGASCRCRPAPVSVTEPRVVADDQLPHGSGARPRDR